MIEAKELRIGNYVSENVLDICTIAGVDTNAAWLRKVGDKGKYSIDFENINPIALTQKILSKCGFKDEPWAKKEIRKNRRLSAC